MLPNLISLDTLLLANETKMLAEATFLKKQMYYNMRIKTTHRNARNIIKMAAEGKRVGNISNEYCNQNYLPFTTFALYLNKVGVFYVGHIMSPQNYDCKIMLWSQICAVYLLQAAVQARQLVVNRLVMQQKEIQRELSEAGEIGDESRAIAEDLKGLEGKLQAIDSRSVNPHVSISTYSCECNVKWPLYRLTD